MKEEILREAGNDESATERLKGIIEKVENNIRVCCLFISFFFQNFNLKSSEVSKAYAGVMKA